MPDIRTAQEWNQWLAACGCCPVPLTPAPRIQCQSQTASANCHHGSEYQAYLEDHATWEAAYQEWLDGGEIGDPPEEPQIPDGTQYACLVQFVLGDTPEPGPMPMIYRKSVWSQTQDGVFWYDGTIGAKLAMNDWWTLPTFPLTYYVRYSDSQWSERVYANEPAGGGTQTDDSVHAEYNSGGGLVSCATSTNGETLPTFDDLTWTLVTPDAYDCQKTTITRTGSKYNCVLNTPEVADSCPGPWGQAQGDAFLRWQWADIEKTAPGEQVVLSDTITREQLIEAAVGNLDSAEWGEGPCVTSLELSWPLAEAYDWDIDCNLLLAGYLASRAASALATVQRMRYKVGVPSGYPATTYDAQWDEGFFPAAWIEWDTGGRVGPEPTPKPTRVAARTWSFSGDDFSAFFTVDPPAEEGEIRIVNMLVAGSQTKYGKKPTNYGDTYDFDA